MIAGKEESEWHTFIHSKQLKSLALLALSQLISLQDKDNSTHWGLSYSEMKPAQEQPWCPWTCAHSTVHMPFQTHYVYGCGYMQGLLKRYKGLGDHPSRKITKLNERFHPWNKMGRILQPYISWLNLHSKSFHLWVALSWEHMAVSRDNFGCHILGIGAAN